MGRLQIILERYHMEKWFRRDNLLILVLAGILLVVIALPTEEPEEKNAASEAGKTEENVSSQDGGLPEGYDDLYEYTEYLENKLEGILTKMNGVGAVEVMITLESSAQQIMEKDESLVRNNTTENDSQGGTRSVYQIDSKEETIYTKTGSEESPYVSKTILPQIAGVVVVAKGGNSGAVKKSIVEIAEALFDIEVHKISVVAMEES